MIGKSIGEMVIMTLALVVLPCYLVYMLIKRIAVSGESITESSENGKKSKPSPSDYVDQSIAVPIALSWETEQSSAAYDMAASIADLVKSKENTIYIERSEVRDSSASSGRHFYH